MSIEYLVYSVPMGYLYLSGPIEDDWVHRSYSQDDAVLFADLASAEKAAQQLTEYFGVRHYVGIA